MNRRLNAQTCSCPGSVAAPLSRREMLQRSANGFGALALSALLAEGGYAAASGPPGPHFPPRAKRIIFCFMDGGVSHVDSFDPKPELTHRNGESVHIDKRTNPTAAGNRKWLGSPWEFNRYGQ